MFPAAKTHEFDSEAYEPDRYYKWVICILSLLPLASDHTRSGKLAAERPCVHLSLRFILNVKKNVLSYFFFPKYIYTSTILSTLYLE